MPRSIEIALCLMDRGDRPGTHPSLAGQEPSAIDGTTLFEALDLQATKRAVESLTRQEVSPKAYPYLTANRSDREGRLRAISSTRGVSSFGN